MLVLGYRELEPSDARPPTYERGYLESKDKFHHKGVQRNKAEKKTRRNNQAASGAEYSVLGRDLLNVYRTVHLHGVALCIIDLIYNYPASGRLVGQT